jgi:uncharacterized protein (DUF952 family)
MSATIVHLTSRHDWSTALKNGFYRDDSLEKDGFIHFSTEVQIVRVANTFYRGQHGLVLLLVDPARLRSELRWEPGVDLTSEDFPHLYGPLNLEAVVRVVDYEPDPDGLFGLPPLG